MAQTKRTRKTPQNLTSFNPRTGDVIGKVPANSPAEVSDLVAAARKVAPEWAALGARGRAHMLKEVRTRIYESMVDIVETVATECGKPRAEALAHDVLPSVLTLLYYERRAPKLLRDERVGGIVGPMFGVASRIEYRPFGVVGCMTPWNYPFFLSFMALVPALVAGNTVVIKPSEVTPQVGELIRTVLDPLPAGVATVVQGAGDVGAAIVNAPCDKVCFVGSPATGRKIAAAAAKHLTPVVMELGGLDAAVVCSDANVDVASSGVLWGSFFNAGQTCASIERVYVADNVAGEFERQLLDKLGRVSFGDEGCDIGSLTFRGQLETVRRHVGNAVDMGAAVLAGGPDGSPNEDGSLWHRPTVLTGVDDAMDVMREETFGPVLPIVRVRDEEEAIRRVNDDGYNLTASVWTTSSSRGRDVAARLRAGTVTINSHGDAAGAPWGPWGGIGESGYGRLGGAAGVREFVAPVHVTRSLTPSMKRLWWYPYDEATTGSLRGLADVLSAPTFKQKATRVPAILKSLGAALKGKI